MDEDQIQDLLLAIPGARRAANGIILGDDNASFYLTSILKPEPGLTQDEYFFAAFCATREIIRLRELKTPHDYLLRLRAMAIVDSPRLVRVMNKRREKFQRENRPWSLTEYYATQNLEIKRYIARLPVASRKIVKSVPYGFVPVTEANAMCVRSVAGNLILVSEALRYFYYFMTIFMRGDTLGVNAEDRMSAAIIALRIMNQSEALDFDLDPRGMLSPHKEAIVRARVNWLIEFTFGHETAHLLCGHMSSSDHIQSLPKDVELTAYSHDLEYEADLFAVRNVVDRDARRSLEAAAYEVLSQLHFLNLAFTKGVNVPSFSISHTHPDPVDRLMQLHSNLGGQARFSLSQVQEGIVETEALADAVCKVVRDESRKDLLTTYGSIYMRGLGGNGRSRDRIDY